MVVSIRLCPSNMSAIIGYEESTLFNKVRNGNFNIDLGPQTMPTEDDMTSDS